MLLALLLTVLPALAQEPGEAEAVVQVAPAERQLATAFVWVRQGQPETRRALDSVAVDPFHPDRWLAVDAGGAVFRSEDAGGSWQRVLSGRRMADGGEASDEAILLDAEAARAEALGGQTVEESDDAEAVTSASARAAAETAETAAQYARTERSLAQTPGRAWFDPVEPDVAMVGRSDGVWRSADGGAAWERVDEELGAAEFFRWGSLLVIGGADGVRASVDGGYGYLDLGGVASGAVVYQFAQVGAALYAATSNGLLRSPDGLHWTRVAAAGSGAVRTVVPDPSWPGGLWVAGEDGVRRSDDDGVGFYAASTQPLRGLRRIVPLAGSGHLLAIGSDGVWESMDGGVRWSLASRLLTEPDVRDVALREGLPVIATAGGVWQVALPQRVVEERAPARDGMPLGDAIGFSLHRAGLDEDVLQLTHRAGLLMGVPTLAIDGKLTSHHGRESDNFLLQTTESREVAWSVVASMCWGGCGASYTTAYTDYSGDALADVLGEGSLSVINGQIYDETTIVAAAANVSSSMSQYRRSVADRLAEAWLTRQRLAAEAPVIAARPLDEQVEHALKIQELDARLDALTDGAWSVSLTASTGTP